jgi:hypothetical protein
VEEEEPQPEAPPARHKPMSVYRMRRVRLGAVLALAIAGGLVAWAVADNRRADDVTKSPLTTYVSSVVAKPIAPIGLSANGLRTLIKSVNQPIYWAGPKSGYLYELTRTNAGKIFIRYLPPDAKVGSKQATYLIVATYPFRNAFQALKNLPDAKQVTIPGGGVAVVDANHPESVHIAYPGINYQLEVYDPSPAQSLRVAKSGDVRPVVAQTRTAVPPPAPASTGSQTTG